MTRSIQQQILFRAETSADQPYLCQPVNRQWRQWTWAEAVAEAKTLAMGLKAQGLMPGDRVGIISRNCAHWVLADMAIILAGLVSVPVYPTANARTIQQIVEHSGTRALFIGKIDEPETQLAGLSDSVTIIVTTIAMPYPEAVGKQTWQALLDAGKEADFELVERQPDELATLLYTSGSTGTPKGAIHSHANFAWVGQALPQAVGVTPGDRVLSYLPLSHCTERAYVEAASFYAESTLYFVESIETFMADLAHARPTLFGSVPRLWKKFQIGVLEKLPQQKLDRLLRIPLLGKLIQRKIKRGLGLDQARWFASGSAPIARSLLEWWDRLGVSISEGWGMTETFAYGTSLPVGQSPRFGAISRALPGVELKISENQELLIRCPCLMQGYYQTAKENNSHFSDGFFRTGDRASIDQDGFVYITGRVKELFKTSKGKYIAPVPIESLLARNGHIELACVMGAGLAQPVALIQLAETAPRDRGQLIDELEYTREQVNAEIEPHERLSRLIVINGTWEAENGMLTPTLKLRRDAIEARYTDLIARSGDSVTFESQA